MVSVMRYAKSNYKTPNKERVYEIHPLPQGRIGLGEGEYEKWGNAWVLGVVSKRWECYALRAISGRGTNWKVDYLCKEWEDSAGD
jgi:hypothetical protein